MTDSQILKEAQPLAVMGPKLAHLLSAARSCENVPGMIAELGVYRGGSSLLLCRAFPARAVFGFDTYSGIPEDDSLVKDGHKKGDFSDTSVARVAQNMRVAGVSNFYPVVGRFEDTHKGYRRNRFAFVNIDCDIYQTAKAAVDFFVPRLSQGGGIFFDDYSSGKCAGIGKVADELFATGNFTREEGHGTLFLKLKPA